MIRVIHPGSGTLFSRIQVRNTAWLSVVSHIFGHTPQMKKYRHIFRQAFEEEEDDEDEDDEVLEEDDDDVDDDDEDLDEDDDDDDDVDEYDDEEAEEEIPYRLQDWY